MEPKTEPSVKSEQQLGLEATQKTVKAASMDDTIAAYERKRLANIQRNIDFMTTMGVSTAKMAARTSIGRPKPVKVTTKRVIPVEQPARKSRRLLGEEAQYELQTAQETMSTEEREEREERNRTVRDGNRRRFVADLYANALDEQGQSVADSMDTEDEADLVVDASGFDDVPEYELRPNDVVKAGHRIYSMAFHPREDKVLVVCGDKKGYLGLWSADQETEDQKRSVDMYKPHRDPISQLCFNPNDASKLISSSFDGTVKQFDLQAGKRFTKLYDGDACVLSVALNNAHQTYLISCEDGSVVSLDQREPKTKQSRYQLHEKRANTVHHHPLLTHCIATASLDRNVCLWDLRQIKKSHSTPLAIMPHYRSVNCAYFSPNGAHIVTVGQDNYLHIYDTHTVKYSDPMKIAPSIAIPHDNQTGPWMTKLHVSWDPKHTTRYVIGCMQQPRRLQIFDAARKNPVQELYSDLFKSVHTINVFHPTLPLIAGGNSSGRLSLWRQVQI